MQKPAANEYDPYFQRYIDLVPEGDIQQLMLENKESTSRFFRNIPADKYDYRYAPRKWTIKEVLMHIVDTERVMAYRAFVAARGDNDTVLYRMDENKYAAAVDVTKRSMDDIIAEFEAVRGATAFIYHNLSEDESKFMARGEKHPCTARGLSYIMIGHIEHHLNIISERYI